MMVRKEKMREHAEKHSQGWRNASAPDSISGGLGAAAEEDEEVSFEQKASFWSSMFSDGSVSLRDRTPAEFERFDEASRSLEDLAPEGSQKRKRRSAALYVC